MGAVVDRSIGSARKSAATDHMLKHWRRNIHSQNGEDGVLAEIFQRMGIEQGWACEVGAVDGRLCSNTYALVERGWRSVMIEGDPLKYRLLLRTAARWPDRIISISAYVSPTDPMKRLDGLLHAIPMPRDFDLLSIDVDGFDYQIWKGLLDFMPKVVVIEVDSSRPHEAELVHGQGGDHSTFASMLQLGRAKGYQLACHTGNMIFVHDDWVERLGLPEEHLTHPERLFVDDFLNPSFLRRYRRKVRNLTPQRVKDKLKYMLATGRRS